MNKISIKLCMIAIFLAGCSSEPPRNVNNSCAIFDEKDDWYSYAYESFEKWGVPVHVQLAIIHQESRFVDDAKAPRDTLLWVIPWGRKSSAYGFGQVKDSTWEWYQKSSGNSWADRDDFEDVTDFIGWYGDTTYRKLGVSKWDARKQYLAYHEGHGGYQRGSYRNKTWLLKVANKVARQAANYRAQLKKCAHKLDKGWSIWPF